MEREYIHKFQSIHNAAQSEILQILAGGHYTCDHSFYENNYYKSGYYLIYAESGQGYLETGRQQRKISAHTMFLIDLSEPYRYYADKREPWVIHWIQFDGATAKYLTGCMGNNGDCVFSLDPENTVYRLFMTLLDCFFNYNDQILLHQQLTNLLCEIIEQKGNLSWEQNELQYPDPVRSIISYIEQNYFRKITLDELAQLTYLNKFYLARLFKQHTGLTVGEFINRFRLEYSRQLLLSEQLAIEQVALNLGFHSHSYFTKCFKREYGITPKTFRENR